MKKLYLVRHAKSCWKNKKLADHDRPLSQRGKRDAPLIGERLRAHGLAPDLVFSSTAKRALKTAKIVVKEMGFPTQKIVRDGVLYEKALGEMLDFLKGIDNGVSVVMLFGHHTELIALAQYLVAETTDHLPTCGVWGIEFAVENWRDLAEHGGSLFFNEYPKKTGPG